MSKTFLGEEPAVRRSGYDVVTLRVAPALEEMTTARLWALGTLGMESRDGADEVLVTAYFEHGALLSSDWHQVADWLASAGVEVVSVDALEEQDWLEGYRQRAKPFRLGRRFRVDPGENAGRRNERLHADGRIPLSLPARRAFGTGSHESTRLVVEILEENPPEGAIVLDVGAGTGILSFAALALGAESVMAFDVDPVAAVLAGQNQVLNGVRFPVFAGRAATMRRGPRFDLVLVNVIPELIEDALEDVVDLLKPSGQMIVSGFLTDFAEVYERNLDRLGLALLEARALGEWSAFRLQLQKETTR